MGYLNRYLLLLAFNMLNVIAFGAIVSVAAVNIADHTSPTNLIIYYAYTGLLSLALFVAEFRAPRLLSSQARFLFTYTGRGLLFTYFGCIVYTNTLYNVVACIYTVSLGVVYLVVAWVPVVPLQSGVLYNWSRWKCEGSEQFYGAEGVAEEHGGDTRVGGKSRRRHEPNATVHRYSSPPGPVAESVSALGVRLSSQATAHELNPNYPAYVSAQSMVWPESPPDLAISVDALTNNAVAQPLAAERDNESFIYGVSVETKQSNTTGDAYLDSIVNSSRFARDVMDGENENQLIVVRNAQSSVVAVSSLGLAGEVAGIVARPYSQSGLGSPLARISSPMPYHVFAPESRESLTENIGHIDRALNEDAYLDSASSSFQHSLR
ncbi:hypothetical protein IWW57_001885 [Coemansia sp. S610]|uniref:Uncharacterized protein n=2 Tax=Coemansia TaxID=4863 RepID=A0A9W8GB77_9FUNG|nr:hypothetical protein IWW57_001885 [Coemansia sp. S610]KAJ2683744.1 hypothetical protein IWW39_005329 [Coemansia spiralis]